MASQSNAKVGTNYDQRKLKKILRLRAEIQSAQSAGETVRIRDVLRRRYRLKAR